MAANDPIAELVALLAPPAGHRRAHGGAARLLRARRAARLRAGARRARSRDLHERVRRCERCGNYTTEHAAARSAATRERDAQRALRGGARPPDLAALERGGSFRGRYHVLHALLAPLDGIGPEALELVAAARARPQAAACAR